MKHEAVQERLKAAGKFLQKYKYAALILLLGLALLLIPSKKKTTTQTAAARMETTDEAEYLSATEARLAQMLSQIDGAGRVSVMLTLQYGKRTEYQLDSSTSREERDGETAYSQEQKTVILSEGSAYDKAAVSAVRFPQFQGALVISQGADSAQVRLALTNAVSGVTGLRADQITVVKMK